MRTLIVALATAIHLLPHPFGVSPVGALALYGGAHGNRRVSWLVPTLPLLVAAIVFGFYVLTVMAFVFAGFMLSALVGKALLKDQRGGARYPVAVVCAAIVFFLVSNFSIWLVGMYPPTAAGLLSCYLNGLPYLGIAIIADSIYCAVFFGLHHQLTAEEDDLAFA